MLIYSTFKHNNQYQIDFDLTPGRNVVSQSGWMLNFSQIDIVPVGWYVGGYE